MDHAHHDENATDGFFGPLGRAEPGDMVSPLDPPAVPDYADTQLLAFLSHAMRSATMRFLAKARSKGHRVQPLPSAHVDPYPIRQKRTRKKPLAVSREAIRVVYISVGGALLMPDEVPRQSWVELADIASQCGLAPGLKAPSGDPTYFALHQGTTVHGAKPDVEPDLPWQTAVRRIANSTINNRTFRFGHSTIDLAHETLEVVLERNLQRLRQVLADKAIYQLYTQAEYLSAKGVPDVKVAQWYVRAERRVLAEVAKRDLSGVTREVTRIVNGKKVASKAAPGASEAKNLDAEHAEVSRSLSQETEGAAKAIEGGEKLSGALKVAGFALIGLEIACDAEEIALKCAEKPKEWPRIVVDEGLQKGAGLAAGLGGGIAGAEVGAELGTPVGMALGVWAFGAGAVPGAAVGALIGSILGAWGGTEGAEDFTEAAIRASEQTRTAEVITDALSREIEKVFPTRDTELTLKNESGLLLTQ